MVGGLSTLLLILLLYLSLATYVTGSIENSMDKGRASSDAPILDRRRVAGFSVNRAAGGDCGGRFTGVNYGLPGG